MDVRRTVRAVSAGRSPGRSTPAACVDRVTVVKEVTDEVMTDKSPRVVTRYLLRGAVDVTPLHYLPHRSDR